MKKIQQVMTTGEKKEKILIVKELNDKKQKKDGNASGIVTRQKISKPHFSVFRNLVIPLASAHTQN